jgi:hypothetical protein
MNASTVADVLLIVAAVVWVLARQVQVARVKPRLLVLAPLVLVFFGIRRSALTCRAGVACAPARRCHGSELPGTAGGVVDASASRACSRARISSGVYAPRRRWSRAITTPPAATLAKAARPSIFHQRICLGYNCA